MTGMSSLDGKILRMALTGEEKHKQAFAVVHSGLIVTKTLYIEVHGYTKHFKAAEFRLLESPGRWAADSFLDHLQRPCPSLTSLMGIWDFP